MIETNKSNKYNVKYGQAYPNHTANTVPLKGKYQKKNVSNNPSMASFTKIYIDFEKL